MNDFYAISLELCKIQAIVNCLDDAITSAVTYTPSDAGDQAICLVDLLQEHLDKLVATAEHPGRGAA